MQTYILNKSNLGQAKVQEVKREKVTRCEIKTIF